MKPITKLYLKVFLFTGIPYGITMTIYDFIRGRAFDLWKFLFLSIGFGIFMSLTVVLWHLRECRKYGSKDFSDTIFTTNQNIEISTVISKEQLIQKLKNDPLTKNRKLKESGNLIVLNTAPSWKSWGEVIQIKLDELENGVMKVLISSKPKFSITFIDYGKNKENIDIIRNLLTKTM